MEALIVPDWQDIGAPSQAFDLQRVPSMSLHKQSSTISTHLSISWVLSLPGASSFIHIHKLCTLDSKVTEVDHYAQHADCTQRPWVCNTKTDHS